MILLSEAALGLGSGENQNLCSPDIEMLALLWDSDSKGGEEPFVSLLRFCKSLIF